MSWRKVLALGGVASAIAIGCTVTVTDGTLDGSTEETGGKSGKDAGTGGAKATGGSAGKATGGSSTGGKGGSSGASTGGKGGASGAGMKDADVVTECMPDKDLPCDYCVETKCCQEWLDCVNDVDCFQEVDNKPPEYSCIRDCLVNDGGSFPDVDECAGLCKHDAVGVSSATSLLIGCMRDTGSGDASNTQNCTNECFGREL